MVVSCNPPFYISNFYIRIWKVKIRSKLENDLIQDILNILNSLQKEKPPTRGMLHEKTQDIVDLISKLIDKKIDDRFKKHIKLRHKN